LRSDNKPEFVARVVNDWLTKSGVETLYIEADAPWRNAYWESSNAHFPDDLLDGEIFTTLAASKSFSSELLRYNEERPHSSLEYQTPIVFIVAQAQTLNSKSYAEA
jgi:transposase InsO family protein